MAHAVAQGALAMLAAIALRSRRVWRRVEFGARKSMTLYTCASDNVEQAVVAAFEKANRGAKVNVFRAATGDLNARVAADVRSGGIKADVIWACDPLTMHGYDEQGLLRAWSPPNAAEIPSADRTRALHRHRRALHGAGRAQGRDAHRRAGPIWPTPAFKGAVALPSPTFAASALGLLGYLVVGARLRHRLLPAAEEQRRGAGQCPHRHPGRVEQGTYQAGVTLANAAYVDKAKGSPIEVVWPRARRRRDLRTDRADHEEGPLTAGREVRLVRGQPRRAEGDGRAGHLRDDPRSRRPADPGRQPDRRARLADACSRPTSRCWPTTARSSAS